MGSDRSNGTTPSRARTATRRGVGPAASPRSCRGIEAPPARPLRGTLSRSGMGPSWPESVDVGPPGHCCAHPGRPSVAIMTVLVPLLIGAAYVALSSLLPEPHRRRFGAVMIAGAGAV